MAQDQIAYPSRSLPQTPISALITTSLRQARSGIARPGAKSDRPTTAPDCHPPDTPTITTWRVPDAAAMAHPDPRSVRPSVLDCHADRAGACGHRPDGGIAGAHPSPLTTSGRCDVTARDASMRVRDGAGGEGHRRHGPYHLRP